jgi:hypothetical protein
MDSPFSFRYVDLTCFPLGAAEHRHLHYAAHGHGYCHHWVSGFEFHGRYFTIIQGVAVNFVVVLFLHDPIQPFFKCVKWSELCPARNPIEGLDKSPGHSRSTDRTTFAYKLV